MNRNFLFLMASLLALVGSIVSAEAQNLSQFTLGQHHSGPQVDLSQTKGKVVAIEFWGTR